MLVYVDMEFFEIEDEEGNKVKFFYLNYFLFIKSKNSRVRKDVFEGEFLIYEKYKNIFVLMFYGGIKLEIFYVKIRKYNLVIEVFLFLDDVSLDVYNNFILVIDKSIFNLNKYVEFKKKFLGLNEIYMYDLYVFLIDKFDMDILYDKV